jgi:hypothetical protein
MFRGGLPKNILEKTLFYEKSVLKYGRLTVLFRAEWTKYVLAPLSARASSKEKENERCQQFGLHCSNATLATEHCCT